jgi:ABC-type branched-subunit amino acid transport system substrate-binding protein
VTRVGDCIFRACHTDRLQSEVGAKFAFENLLPGSLDVPRIIKQARAKGYRGPVLGTDGWDSPKLIEWGGAAVERDALKAADCPTITGQVKFDESRNPVKPVVIIQVKSGKLAYHSTVNS